MAQSPEQEAKTIRIAFVEDQAELRLEISQLLGAVRGFLLLGQYDNAEVAVKELPALRPDVVLVDIRLPGMNGVECVQRLKPLLPSTEFMMLTVFDDIELIYQSMRVGATGYLLKKSIPLELIDSVVDLHAGGSPMSAAIARKVVQCFAKIEAGASCPSVLTTREKEILIALAKGKIYKEIASELHVSFHTVRTHVNRIYKKLQVNTREEAIQKVGGKSVLR